MSNTGANRVNQGLNSKITEQKVLQDELKSIRKGARVYKQQQNSSIFFLSSADREMAQSKKTMDSLGKEYKDMERLSGGGQDGGR
ncbi:ASNSD1 upstream open reading frame protein-like [Haliotis rufescens]|uniref:ASNSD1 upstream open reading frame protein-like n=1 Tax=Haliotis rufescens TaxID=6454 RepID=UPI00201F8EE7|nr:ASNSD1 upstream open reading frame protein-like [Haliotis rufescens]